jgi:hypothetical protein
MNLVVADGLQLHTIPMPARSAWASVNAKLQAVIGHTVALRIPRPFQPFSAPIGQVIHEEVENSASGNKNCTYIVSHAHWRDFQVANVAFSCCIHSLRGLTHAQDELSLVLQPDVSTVSVGAFAMSVFAAIKAGAYMKSVPNSAALNNVRLPEFPDWHQKLLIENDAEYFRTMKSAQKQPKVDYRGATPAHVAVSLSSIPAVISAAIDGTLCS